MPVVIVNFKTYQEATGQRAVELAKVCEKVSKATKTDVIAIVQNIDLFHVSSEVSIPVFGEHVDPIRYGAHTGKVLPESLLENGAFGVIINHSEDRLPFDIIKQDIERAKSVGLRTLVCGQDAEECKKIAYLGPDMIAVEPPELIGGEISVSKANPKLIQDTLWLVHEVDNKIPVLCGAGIKDHEDVRIAYNFGCEGILLASGITKNQNPEGALRDLIKGFRKSRK